MFDMDVSKIKPLFAAVSIVAVGVSLYAAGWWLFGSLWLTGAVVAVVRLRNFPRATFHSGRSSSTEAAFMIDDRGVAQ
ncbi:MAG TPA: hypothetical protein VIV56_14130 [Gemmatimonadales bacterium]